MDFDDYNDGFAADSVYTGTTTSGEQPAKEKKSDKSRRSRSRDRSPRGRGRRDRSRSHDRRDRRDDRRDRSRSRDRRRSRSRSRSRSRDRRRRPSRPADNLKQVTLKGLPRGCDANAIYPVLDTIAMYIGTVAKLEMVDSSSATIDMETEEGAKMLAMYGNLEIDGKPCPLEANFKTENVKQEARRSTDWVCVQCNTMNFARRQECFQCQASRLGNSIAVEDTVPHYDMGDRGGGSNQAARAPKEDTTLLVRDIPELASEQSVRNAFNPFGQLTEVRHLPERRLAFVEFESTSSLQQAMRQADERGIRVDGKYVTVTVARGRDNPPSGGDKSGAHAAIEQAMAMAQVLYCSGWLATKLALEESLLDKHLWLNACFSVDRQEVLPKDAEGEKEERREEERMMQLSHVKSRLVLRVLSSEKWLFGSACRATSTVQVGPAVWLLSQC